MIEFTKFLHLIDYKDGSENIKIAKGKNKIPKDLKELIKWLKKG